MKTLALLFSIIGVGLLRADDSAQKAQWDADFHESANLAAKLYPEIVRDDSKISALSTQMANALKDNGGVLYSQSCKPVVITTAAGASLNLNPNWAALSEDEKYKVFLSLSYALSESRDFKPSATATASPATSWKPGDDLGTITTTNGTVYSMAKLQSVDPDGITILDSDGGAKISFEKLSPDLQKRFGYDPQKSVLYAQQQVYEQKLAALQQEVYQLRKALGETAQNQKQAASVPAPSKSGYIYFYNYLSNQSRWTSTNHAAAKAIGGPFNGMTWGEAQNQAQKLWEAMAPDDKTIYEQKSQAYGAGIDPAAPQPPEKDDGQHHGARMQTVYNSDGSTSEQMIVDP